MKKLAVSTFAALVLAIPLVTPVLAQTAPAAAPASPHTFTGNATVISDYRFRGISQTYRGPAFQGGFDYAHGSGFYLGNWNSNVSTAVYPSGAGLEMDLYGGWKKSFGDFNVDLGSIYYLYPGAKLDTTRGTRKFNNWEAYVGFGYKFVSFKAYYALTPYFGLDGALAQSGYWADKSRANATLPDRGTSRGTLYYDLTLAYEVIPKLTLIGHVGYTDVRKYNELDYLDYKVGATYDYNGWLFGASVIGTDAKKQWYYTAGSRAHIRQTGQPALVVSLGKTF